MKLNTDVSKADLEGRTVLLSEEHYRGDEEARKFVCEDGFGLRPFLSGQAIFGRFVSDGTRARVERYQVAGVYEPETKPTKCILLVEDDDLVARAISRKLARHDINVVRATTQVTAIRIIREGAEFIGVKCEIGAVLTDWSFPWSNDGWGPRDGAGEATYLEAKERGLPVAVMSGDGPVPGFEPWISKPDTQGDLTAWIQVVLPAL